MQKLWETRLSCRNREVSYMYIYVGMYSVEITEFSQGIRVVTFREEFPTKSKLLRSTYSYIKGDYLLKALKVTCKHGRTLAFCIYNMYMYIS